jgi:hypothetical protein
VIEPHFEPTRLLRALHEYDVAFVVIGGIASLAHGSPSLTRDLDICYERSRGNLESLAVMLLSVHATPRGFPEGLPFKLDATTLGLGDSFTFATDFGDFDCLGTPSGTRGYGDLAQTAVEASVEGLPVKIAAVDDLIRMKRAAGRPKDLAEIEILGALRQRLDQAND